ncbi:GspH/FimT family pseudopilin [Marinobacter sp.]|uniref:GspH/FimT family pseudopilin n=1 Tax=Marinobacter sp. TaxID=50741 RepID=UPI002B27C0BC|nr:GspH/FimT family pseudopilin [Marinobacter sp.]
MLKKTSGFTIIELMITMAVLVIIATVAIPGFGRLIDANQLTSGTNLITSSFKFARSEAIKRGTNVTLSTGGDISSGWCIHAGDATGSCAADQIREFESPDDLAFTESTSDFVFDRRGFLVPQEAQFLTIAPADCVKDDTSLRRIRISPVGRIEIQNEACP